MPSLPAPVSRAELIARARHEARVIRGRSAFVRDTRVLPIGVPLAALAAAAVLVSAQRARRGPARISRSRRRQRADAVRDVGLAVLAAGGTLALTWLAARGEWGWRERDWRDAFGD